MKKPNNLKHLAGIIPVAGQPLDFGFPWHDSLQPIAKNMLAIERAVIECACAGCNTIWIICPYGMQPLIRYRIGEFAQDPKFFKNKDKMKINPEDLKIDIPIYYIPSNPYDREKRYSLVWSMIYGIEFIQKTSSSMSLWSTPQRYYISWPYGVYNPWTVLKFRKEVIQASKFVLSFNGKTIKDGEYLGIALKYEDCKKLRLVFRDKSTGVWDPTSESVRRTGANLPSKRLPIEERYSGRFITLKDIFSSLDLTDSYQKRVNYYWNIDSWTNLKNYLSDPNSSKIKKPKRNIICYRELSGMSNKDPD